jgi:hypothetical protein
LTSSDCPFTTVVSIQSLSPLLSTAAWTQSMPKLPIGEHSNSHRLAIDVAIQDHWTNPRPQYCIENVHDQSGVGFWFLAELNRSGPLPKSTRHSPFNRNGIRNYGITEFQWIASHQNWRPRLWWTLPTYYCYNNSKITPPPDWLNISSNILSLTHTEYTSSPTK